MEIDKWIEDLSDYEEKYSQGVAYLTRYEAYEILEAIKKDIENKS